MTPIEALHTAVRRLCTDRYRQWAESYAALDASGGARRAAPRGWSYTAAALAIFPRYRVLDSALVEVERFVPTDFASVEEARALLAEACAAAKRDIPEVLRDPASAAAVEDEVLQFRAAVLALVALDAVEPLPFRRVLAEAEADRLYKSVCARFGTWYGGFPDRTIELEQLTLGARAVGEARLDTLASVAPPEPRLFELRETGPSYELEPAAARFWYTGAEVNIVPPSLAWMFYASHEDTVSFVGTELVARVKSAWPEWQSLR